MSSTSSQTGLGSHHIFLCLFSVGTSPERLTYLASGAHHSGSSLWGLYLLPVPTARLLRSPLWPRRLPETPLPALLCEVTVSRKPWATAADKTNTHRTQGRIVTCYYDVLVAPDIINRTAQVMWPVSEGTVGAVFAAVALCICFMDTWSCLIVAEMISALCVTCCPM